MSRFRLPRSRVVELMRCMTINNTSFIPGPANLTDASIMHKWASAAVKTYRMEKDDAEYVGREGLRVCRLCDTEIVHGRTYRQYEVYVCHDECYQHYAPVIPVTEDIHASAKQRRLQEEMSRPDPGQETARLLEEGSLCPVNCTIIR